MATVALDFVPPYQDDIVALHIYESGSQDGPWTQIESVTQIGAFPDYISHYTTTLASGTTSWFAIAWEDAKGAMGAISPGVQGGTTLLVGEITNRVMLRDSSLNESVVAQEAEAVVEDFFPGQDAVDVPRGSATARELSGMTMLTLARVALVELLTAASTVAATDYTAGLVTIKNSTASATKRDLKTIKGIIEMANNYLGKSYSVILLAEEIEVAGGYKQLVSADISREIVEYE